MRIPLTQHDSRARFNITPLIDVVFLLIIFFLVSSHFVRNEVLEEVELPVASEISDEESPTRLIVTITTDNQLHVAGKVVEQADVEGLILAGYAQHADNFEVHIRADRRIAFKIAEPILIAAARAGVTKVKFPVEPRIEGTVTP